MPLTDCASVPTSTASRTAAISTGTSVAARSRSQSSRTGHVVRWSSTSPHACSSE